MTPVILSGGSGPRLWPLSRALRPKQFLGLTSEQTLFQRTLARLPKIAIGERHCLADPGKLALEHIKVQSGSHLGEDDIVRLANKHRRS